MTLQGFNEDFYLNAKLAALSASYPEWTGKSSNDLKQFLSSVGLTPEQHYELYGWGEGLNPNALFNGDEYTAYKAQDLFNSLSFGFVSLDQARQAFLDAWPQNPYLHYLQFGGAEGPDMSGLNPGNGFDSSSYLEAKLAKLQADAATQADWTGKTTKDLAQVLADNGLTPLTHYLAWGRDEGLTPTPVPAGEQPAGSSGTPGEVFVLTEEIDNLTGTANDDTFRGNAKTINGGDSIDGGAGVDTFEMFPDGGNNPPVKIADTMSLSNVEIIHSRGNLDVVGVPGLQEAGIIGDTPTELTLSAGMTALVKEKGPWEGTTTVTTVTFDGDQPTDTATLKLDSIDRYITLTAQAETVNLANTGESFVGFTDNVLTDLSISGEGSLNGSMYLDELKTLHISGSLDIDLLINFAVLFYTPSNLTVIDAGTANGDLTITAASVKGMVATTGSGNDVLTVENTFLNEMEIDLGGGEDEIILFIKPTETVTPDFYTAVNAVKNAEILGIEGSMNVSQEVDFTKLNDIDSLALHGTKISQVSGATDSTTITFTGTNGAATAISSLTGQNTIGLNLMAEGTTVADLSTNGATVTGTTTVNLDSSQEKDDGTLVNKLALTVNDNQTVNVTGNAGLELTLIDAQPTMTSGIILNAAATTKGITMTTAINNQVTSDQITGGSGDDTLLSGAIGATKTGDILTGGDGNDTFDVSNSFITTTTAPEMVTITDVASGETIKLVGSAATMNAEMTNVASASSLNDFLAQVMAVNTTAHNIAWGQYEQNTYLVVANDTNGEINTGEQVVKLEGTVDLSGAAVDGTFSMLTLA